ncbi:MAG: hypothetical protein IJY15_09395, partial [Thermoguttaceae bacterium]|nr:hypothetical protein [Thermoguttaceae bacterium]
GDNTDIPKKGRQREGPQGKSLQAEVPLQKISFRTFSLVVLSVAPFILAAAKLRGTSNPP